MENDAVADLQDTPGFPAVIDSLGELSSRSVDLPTCEPRLAHS